MSSLKYIYLPVIEIRKREARRVKEGQGGARRMRSNKRGFKEN
jgi:hypothetical protein